MPAPINLNDIERNLEPRHREAMLDLVLTWGTLDGAFGMLLAHVIGLPLDQAADLSNGYSSSARLAEIYKALKTTPSGEAAAQFIKRNKKTYEKHSKIRNYIAHSHCVGFVARDHDRIAFASFREFGAGMLSFELVSIHAISQANSWGLEMINLINKVSNSYYPDSDK